MTREPDMVTLHTDPGADALLPASAPSMDHALALLCQHMLSAPNYVLDDPTLKTQLATRMLELLVQAWSKKRDGEVVPKRRRGEKTTKLPPGWAPAKAALAVQMLVDQGKSRAAARREVATRLTRPGKPVNADTVKQWDLMRIRQLDQLERRQTGK